MKNRKIYFFITLIGIAVILVYLLMPHQIKIKKSNELLTEIQFEHSKLDIGDIKLGDKKEFIFKYKNMGENPLILKNVQMTCGCTNATWSKTPLLKLQEDKIIGTFTAESEGKFQKSIYVVCNIFSKMCILTIEGRVITH